VPELPEVQTVVNTLQSIKNKKILNFTIYWDKVIFSNNYKYFANNITNKKIVEVYRIGKYIIIKVNNNYLAFHLRMTGYLYHSKLLNKNKYIRCYFKLSNNTFLIFEDIRKFGGFHYLEDIMFIKNKLGIDPFNKNFNIDWLNKNLFKKNRQMKGLLLDQKFITGLGNIYIDEILWKSKIHPLNKSNNLSQMQRKNLFNNIVHILKQSIKFHGTTIINFKFDNMKTGDYKSQLNIYGRQGGKCNLCYTIIKKIKVSGRGTYICTNCQTE
tara:strand:+ start:39 stop:845 length:807 start_codon:yes stop_codon:yes gene_type:complete